MPRIYRAMMMAEDGKPVVEKSARGLGVREPEDPHADIEIDNDGNILRNGKGMSVSRHWRFLPVHRLPRRLDDGFNGAKGPNSNHCWRMGDGEFVAAPITNGLELVLKPASTTNGVVAPGTRMLLAEYQTQLAATRNEWVEDED